MFLVPVIIFLLIPFLILLFSKENFYNLNKIKINENKYLVGFAYNEDNYNYLKYKYIQDQKKIEVLVLGSSRVLQFRSEMFIKSFFNAGFTVKSVSDFEEVLRQLPKDKLPKYLIIGLDQWMFNKSYDDLKADIFEEKNSTNLNTNNSANGLVQFKNIYLDIFSQKLTMRKLVNHNDYTPIGINAIINDTGFRNDGSMQYGIQIQKLLSGNKTAEDFKYQDTFERIRNGNRRFEYAKNMNIETLPVLESLLKFCTQNKIKVTGFLPPFADEVYNAMKNSNNYLYFNEILPNTESIFYKYGAEIYSFSSMEEFNSSDLETLDGFHGSEKAYLRILIEMIDRGSVLGEVCQIDQLKADLSHCTNNYEVYPY